MPMRLIEVILRLAIALSLVAAAPLAGSVGARAADGAAFMSAMAAATPDEAPHHAMHGLDASGFAQLDPASFPCPMIDCADHAGTKTDCMTQSSAAPSLLAVLTACAEVPAMAQAARFDPAASMAGRLLHRDDPPPPKRVA